MSARARAAALALLIAGLLVPGSPAAAQSGEADVRGAAVVVVGAPGLRWSDVEPSVTPALHALSERSAVGVASVKALPAVSCPADGWLTLGAGARAQAFGVQCGALDADRRDQAGRNATTRDAADVDALARALRDAGTCVSALGPGAELAGGDPLTDADADGGTGPPCPVLLLDAPAVEGDGAVRADDAAAVDAVVARVVADRAPDSTLLVLGVSQAPDEEVAQLQLALAEGPSLPPGALRSASTRRAPYVQLVDVAPTVLALLDVPLPAEVAGRPWQSVGAAPTVEELVQLEARAAAAKAAQVPFFVALIAGALLGLAVAATVRSWRVVEVVGLAGLGAVLGSLLVALLPWHRAPSPLLALLGVAAAAAVVGVAVLLAVPQLRARPAARATAACSALAAVLLLDLATGARLQIDTPTGYSPLVAGRFAGLGNVGFGVVAAAVLLALAGLSARRHRSVALAVVAGGGAVAVALVGAPDAGSDVGGVLALLPAVVLLALLRMGARVSLLRLVLAGGAAVLVVAVLALADAARPAADRTHLGRFVEQVADGTAGAVLQRKADAVLDLLLANAATALLPVVVAAAVLLVARPPAALRRAFDAEPAWRHGVLAVGLASAVGFAVNDSGPAIPALALVVAVPATLAVTGAAARVADVRRPAGAPGR